jgi:hypothetical protein
MPMNQSSITLGATFIDTALSSQPAEYRIHQVERITEDHVVALHIASDSLRTFPIKGDALKHLTPVPNFPDVLANLDCLVGRKVRMDLKNGGSLTGTVTAVRYTTMDCEMLGKESQTLRQVQSVEIDHSGTTRYTWPEIQKISVSA